MTVVYEKSFDLNEWFVIISLISLIILMLFTPKIFSVLEGTAYFLFGVCAVTFFDHTISVRPWDFYDVNDTSNYQLMDFIYYLMNGPCSYFFIYLYVKLRIKGFMNIIYILIWSCLAVLMEWIGLTIELFHFDKGYSMYWSFPIYMLLQCSLIIFYHSIKRRT